MTDEPYKYLGKTLAEYSLEDLQAIKTSLDAAELVRLDAAQHPKFTTGSARKPKMEFPPPNPNYLILKQLLNAEIDSRG